MNEPLVQNPVAVFLIIIAVILLAPLLTERFRLPGVVGLIVGGIVIGPHMLHLVSTEYTIESLAVIGLVYLMFSVGLEIDLRQFKRVRHNAVVLGLFFFTIPQLAGIAIGRWLGYSWTSSMILGAVVASHALINYPILSRLGILRNDAVAATLGATVFTDVSAILVLASVVRATGGEFSAVDILLMIAIVLGYTVLILFLVPRLGKMFFRRVKGRAVEFQFILVVLLLAALLAELIDLHVIIGAFLAGLAINSTLPSRSSVVNRVLFMGEAFFIPIFLLYIGMIVDPAAIFTESSTLIAGWIMIMTVYLTKLIASWIGAGIFHYDRDELFTIWGISQAQATTTLAILLVGVDLGLLSSAVFNGGVMMVMVTCITSPLLVQRFGSKLVPTFFPEEGESHYERILVSVANPETQEHLIELANILARTVKGRIFPLHIIPRRHGECYWEEGRLDLLTEAENLDEPEGEIQPVCRVDTSISEGILSAAIENHASMIIMGWRGERAFRESIFGGIIDQVLVNTELPVMVGRVDMPINAIRRLVLVVPPNSLVLGSLEDILKTVTTIAEALNVPMLALSDDSYLERLRYQFEKLDAGPQSKIYKLGRSITRDVESRVGPHDLVVVTTVVSNLRFFSSLGRVPEYLADNSPASLAVIIHPSA
jgi:Kef-type K+ transport system membrane component KefB/nucleotide-binding universal stress UspA family protein